MTDHVLLTMTQSLELFTCRQKVADDFCPVEEKLVLKLESVWPCRALNNFVSNFAILVQHSLSTKCMCMLLCVDLLWRVRDN